MRKVDLMNSKKLRLGAGAAGVLLLWVASAAATDGVIDINEARALAGGITTGDTPGYPVRIATSGSFRLTGNLNVAGQANGNNLAGMLITASNVTVDLNGFAILGPAFCSGIPLSCSSTGTGDGIVILGEDVIIRNGTIKGAGRNGILAHEHGTTVENVRFRSNGASAVNNDHLTRVTDCLVLNNGATGIIVAQGSVVSHNVVSNNLGDGVSFGSGSTVDGNVVVHNTGEGLLTSADGSRVVGNAVTDNGDDGLSGADAAITVVENTFYRNLNAGIRTDYGSTFLRNAVRSNTVTGFPVGLDSGYAHNVFTANGASEQQGAGGIQLGGNFCGSDTTCP